MEKLDSHIFDAILRIKKKWPNESTRMNNLSEELEELNNDKK